MESALISTNHGATKEDQPWRFIQSPRACLLTEGSIGMYVVGLLQQGWEKVGKPFHLRPSQGMMRRSPSWSTRYLEPESTQVGPLQLIRGREPFQHWVWWASKSSVFRSMLPHLCVPSFHGSSSVPCNAELTTYSN